MEYMIDKTLQQPAYLQLYRLLRADIVAGNYPYGRKLPSKRLLAQETGVSTVTVEHAYALLCDEGYAEARERSGYIVRFRTGDWFAAAEEAGARGSASEQPLPLQDERAVASSFPFSVLAKTMRGVLSTYGERILARSPHNGCAELREAVARYLARSRGILVGAEQIVIGSGSEYLYGLIVGLLGRERVYAIESPSYKKIEQTYRAAGVVCEPLPLGRDGIESAALWSSRADVLHISPYRSFPSGVTASASKRHEYTRWGLAEERYIVEDDFESEFSVSKLPKETVFMHTPNGRVIYMNTFSRTVSPSLRIGYMVLPPQLLPCFRERMGFYACTVPTYMQLVLAELLVNGDFERHINRVRRELRMK